MASPLRGSSHKRVSGNDVQHPFTRIYLDSSQDKQRLDIILQVLFDALGCLRKYESPLDILKEFYELRLERYAIRKAWLEGMLTAESDKLNNQARFILEKIEGHIIIGKCSFRFLSIE